MYLVGNIDVVQFDLKQGQTEYYFPKNVNWAGKKIDKILFYFPIFSKTLSPINGKKVKRIDDLHVNLYNDKGEQVARELSVLNVCSVYINNVYRINDTINTSLSRIHLTKAPEDDQTCLLCYVFYDGSDVETAPETKNSVTVKFDIKEGERISLQDLVDNYISLQPAKVKGLVYTPGMDLLLIRGGMVGWCVTLRDRNKKRVLNNIQVDLFRASINAWELIEGDNTRDPIYSDYLVNLHPFFLQEIDIDMLNSYIENTSGHDTKNTSITFLY